MVDLPHHVTQRANGRRYILNHDDARRVYLNLLREHSAFYKLSLVGYCLMSNHVHLVVVPRRPDSLALAMKHTNGRYASYWNATQATSGHAWQSRPYSSSKGASRRRGGQHNQGKPETAMAQTARWLNSICGRHCDTRN